MPRTATKAHPPTPAGAGAADAAAQEADEAPMTKAPVTYSRKKKNPAASEAAAAAVTGTHCRNNLFNASYTSDEPLPPCVIITAHHAALY